jgi:hypothetical protein
MTVVSKKNHVTPSFRVFVVVSSDPKLGFSLDGDSGGESVTELVDGQATN